MIDAVVRLLGDEALRRELGAAARRSARTSYSERAVVKESANLIHEVFGIAAAGAHARPGSEGDS